MRTKTKRTTRTTEITVERVEVQVINKIGKRNTTAWCAECGEAVTTLTLEGAAMLTGANWREISRRVDDGRAHFTETPDGRLLICVNSLSR